MMLRTLAVVIVVSLIFAPGTSRSQEFEVPKKYSFEKKEDYAKYQPEILKCIDFLESAPYDGENGRREEANMFFMTWARKAPNISLRFHSYINTLTSVNPDFFVMFIAGWTRRELTHPGTRDMTEYDLAGIRSIIKTYGQAQGVRKDAAVEEVARLDKEGKLLKWLKPKLGPEVLDNQ